MADHAKPKKVAPAEPGKDAHGREFAGETTLSESAGGPRVLGPPQRPATGPPRPPRPPIAAAPPPSAKRAPDPAVPGSQYYVEPGKPEGESRRALSTFGRDGDRDSDADELTMDEDLGELTRRKDRERTKNAPSDDSGTGNEGPHGGARRDLDAEARPRELEGGSPDIHGRRRRFGP